MWRTLFIGFVAASGVSAVSAEPLGDERPPYKRLLTGNSAIQAATLEARIILIQQGDQYGEAIKLGEELLALRQKAQGADHWEAVDEKWNLEVVRKVAVLSPEDRAAWRKSLEGFDRASQLRTEGRSAEAISLCRERLANCKKVLGDNHPETAVAVNELARNIASAGDPASAHPLYEQALAIWKKTLGELHPDTASGYNNVALNLDALDRSREATPLMRAVLKSRQAVLGEDDDDTIVAYNNLGLNLQYQGKLTEAESLFRRALEGTRRGRPVNERSIARGCLNLSLNLFDQGRSAEALPLAREAVAVCRRTLGENHPHTATCFNNLGNVLSSQGKHADAEAAHRAALEIRRRVLGEDHPHTATSINNLAMALAGQHRYEEAEPLLLASLEIRKKVHGERHSETAMAYMNLAANAAKSTDRADAIKLCEKALDIFRETIGERHTEYARALHNLSAELSRVGRQADAENQGRAALAIWRDVYGEYHEDTAIEYTGLAGKLLTEGKESEALKLAELGARSYEGARVRLATAGLQRSTFSAKYFPYRLLAAIRARLHEPQEAWLAVEADLARGLLEEDAGRRQKQFTADEQKEQQRISQRLAEIQPRLVQLVSASDAKEPDRAELTKLQTERRDLEASLADVAVAASQRELAPLDRVQEVLPKDAALVMWVDVSGGGVEEHWGCVVRHASPPEWVRLRGHGPDGTWTLDDNELTVRVTSDIAYGKLSASDLKTRVERLRSLRIAPLLPHLAGIKTLYVVPVNDMSGVPIEAIAPEFTVSYVPSGTFLVRAKEKSPSSGHEMLALGDPIYGNSSNTPSTPPALPPGGLLVTQVAPDGAAAKARLQAGDVLVRYGDIDVTTVEKLGEEIKAKGSEKEIPISIWREGAEKLLPRAVPPGKLGIAISTEPARDVVANRRKTENLLLAQRGGDWKDLPGTRVEVQRLAKLFGEQATTLVDSAASEQTLDALREKDELAKFRYLHFATHGETSEVRAFDSVLILSQDKLPKVSPSESSVPLIDGQLSAQEVLDHWKLDADLVTLSACETALGQTGGGDGLLGFAQAFLTAGSRSVCLSLWKVDDMATVLLMNRFYQNLLGKRPGLDKPLGKAAALAEAKAWLRELSSDEAAKLTEAITKDVDRRTRGKDEELKLVLPARDPKKPEAKDAKPFAHPRYWSAFVLIGDPN